MHVAVGFMPAFKYRQKNSLIVFERGHKAHGYVSAGDASKIPIGCPPLVTVNLDGFACKGGWSCHSKRSMTAGGHRPPLQCLQERDEIFPILVRQTQPKGMSFHSRDAARVKPLLECLYCAAVLQRTAVPHTSK